MSSSIPSWQISTAHAQPFRGARDVAFCQKVPLDSLLVWVSSEGSGKTARMRRLAWTFAARIGDKYQNRLMRSKCKSWAYGLLCIFASTFFLKFIFLMFVWLEHLLPTDSYVEIPKYPWTSKTSKYTCPKLAQLKLHKLYRIPYGTVALLDSGWEWVGWDGCRYLLGSVGYVGVMVGLVGLEWGWLVGCWWG